jgi:hypothetical protein
MVICYGHGHLSSRHHRTSIQYDPLREWKGSRHDDSESPYGFSRMAALEAVNGDDEIFTNGCQAESTARGCQFP